MTPLMAATPRAVVVQGIAAGCPEEDGAATAIAASSAIVSAFPLEAVCSAAEGAAKSCRISTSSNSRIGREGSSVENRTGGK